MSTTPRVFHLITRLLKGGADTETIETVRGLDGYDFIVGHGASYDPDQVARLHDDGVPTRCFRTIRHYNPVTTVPAVLAVAKYIRAEDVDLVHTHSTEAGIIGRFAAALARIPAVVHTVHGVPFADDRNAALERFVLACERLAARHTDQLIANADAITAEYVGRDIGHYGQYRTVYSGIDLDQFRAATPAADIDAEGIRVLMVTRLADGKGFDVLFDALEAMDSSITVYIAGEGPERPRLERSIAARRLDDTVRLLGYREDVPALLAASDVFVLPSYREGTPRAITEAMASGLPVVATRIAGIPEQVIDGATGYLVDPGDARALADRLDVLIAHPDRRRAFGAAARDRAQRFSRDRMLVDLDAVYTEVLAEAGITEPRPGVADRAEERSAGEGRSGQSPVGDHVGDGTVPIADRR